MTSATENVFLTLSDAGCVFTVFFLSHLGMGLASVVIGGLATASGECIYLAPFFLLISGSIMLLAAFFPPLAVLNFGPLVWGTVSVLGVYEDFLARLTLTMSEKTLYLHHSSCDDRPFVAALALIVTTWGVYAYLFIWILLECDVGAKFRAFKAKKRDQRLENTTKNERTLMKSKILDGRLEKDVNKREQSVNTEERKTEIENHKQQVSSSAEKDVKDSKGSDHSRKSR